MFISRIVYRPIKINSMKITQQSETEIPSHILQM